MFPFKRLILILIIATGCGDKKEDAAAAGSETFVEGTWDTACAEAPTGYEKKSVTFDKDDFSYASYLYSDDACATLDNTISGRGHFTLSGAVAIENVGTGTGIDYKFDELTWTFIADASTAVDYAAACKATADHGVVDILGKTCTIGEEDPITFPKKAYGTVLLQELELLITDINSNGGTEEDRSKEIAIDSGWTKAEEVEDDETDEDEEAELL